MSIVTDVILTVPCGADDRAALDHINKWLIEHKYGTLGDDVTEAQDPVGRPIVGGNKVMQAQVYMGAFNYLRIDVFLQVVRDAPWYRDEFCNALDDVRCFMKEEHEDAFRERLHEPGGTTHGA